MNIDIFNRIWILINFININSKISITPLGSDLKNLIEIGKKRFNTAFSVVEELLGMLALRNKTIVISFSTSLLFFGDCFSFNLLLCVLKSGERLQTTFKKCIKYNLW